MNRKAPYKVILMRPSRELGFSLKVAETHGFKTHWDAKFVYDALIAKHPWAKKFLKIIKRGPSIKKQTETGHQFLSFFCPIPKPLKML